MAETTVIIICGVLAVPLLGFVHCGLERCYVRFGHRFCTKRGLTVSKYRCGPEFDNTGVKTEYSIVELDCIDPHKGRQLVRLLVWIFGVRKVLNIEAFPEVAVTPEEKEGQQTPAPCTRSPARREER